MVQIIEQTREEKLAMYMKLPKKEIAEMLINCNDLIHTLTKNNKYTSPISMNEWVCDSCGCRPNVIYATNKGRFCEKCKPIGL